MVGRTTLRARLHASAAAARRLMPVQAVSYRNAVRLALLVVLPIFYVKGEGAAGRGITGCPPGSESESLQVPGFKLSCRRLAAGGGGTGVLRN
jgi:hypothetical protein